MNHKPQYYQGMMGCTSAFLHCGNCFRLDSYKGCSFGCDYCFANNRNGGYKHDFRVGSVSRFRHRLVRSIIDNDTSNLTYEMLNHKVPLHLGGMSDPFQHCESKYKITLGFLEASRDFEYPINISTKFGNTLSDEYWECLNPLIHTFSISLIGINQEYVSKFESNTPSVKSRLEFIQTLKDKGFFVGVRIQPIIDINETIKLVEHLNAISNVDFITLEHIKISQMNRKFVDAFMPKVAEVAPFVLVNNEYQVRSDVKKKNIELLKSISRIPIGVGDDDLHHLSDTDNCCGLDLMPKAFENWHKYNTMYLNKKAHDVNVWYPKNDCNRCFNPLRQKSGCITMSDYMLRYKRDHEMQQQQLVFNL